MLSPRIRNGTAWTLFLLSCPIAWSGFHTLAPFWPPLVGLAIILLTRRVLIGLLTGAASGVLLLQQGRPDRALPSFFSDHLLPALQSEWNLSVLVFTFLMGGFVALIEFGGGLQGLIGRGLRGTTQPARRAQAVTTGLGLLCFFDGLANSMLVGRVMRPVCDRVGVSRAKLAYLVDSTSSPVACVAFISTWIAYQLSMIRTGLEQAGRDDNPYALFAASLPYNFYCWFTLLLVLCVVWNQWHIGPMRDHEAATHTDASPESSPTSPPAGSSWRALLPLAVLATALLGGIYWNGSDPATPWSWQHMAEAFGRARADQVLLWASVLGCATAWLCNRRSPEGSEDAGTAFLSGVVALFVPVLILVAAWCLGSTLKGLHTAPALAGLLHGHLPVWLLPAGVFLLGSAISFTTGTSWGTMGVLMPLALPTALALTTGSDPAQSHLILVATIAAVFSGAVFGDHCSPVSDTTVVSSLSSGTDPLTHVQTQFPYALLAAGLALLLGFLPAGLGIHPGLSLSSGLGLLLILSRRRSSR